MQTTAATVPAPAATMAPVSLQVAALLVYELVSVGRHPALKAARVPAVLS